MASKLADRVRSLRIQSYVDNSTQGFALRTLLQSNVDALTESLQGVFDSLPTANNYIHIERIALDLSVDEEVASNKAALFQVLSQQFSKALYQQVSVRNHAAWQYQHDTLQDEGRLGRSPLLAATLSIDPSLTQISNNIHEISQKENLLSAFIYFLHNGVLPWHEMPEAELYSAWVAASESEQLKALISTQIKSFLAQQRWLYFLVQHFSSDVVLTCIRSSMAPLENFEYAFIRQLLSENPDKPGHDETLTSLGQNHALITNITLIAIITLPKQSSISVAAIHGALALLNNRLAKHNNKDELAAQVVKQLNRQYLQVDIKPHAIQAGVNPDTRTASPDIASKEEAQTLRVSFAGMVLFTPYLPRLFAKQGWLTAQKSLKQEHINIAAKALCYLCQGQNNLPEYQLALIKVFLGMCPQDLLLLDATSLPKALQEELDLLTNSLISHWEKIGNTSIAGLRNTFIARTGLLLQQEQAWVLKIDRAGFDIMLDFLPFSISTIKLPWITFPIQLTW